MKPLPKSEWQVKRCGLDHLIVGMHTNGGAIFWTKFALADLPNEFVSEDDLKRAVVNALPSVLHAAEHDPDISH